MKYYYNYLSLFGLLCFSDLYVSGEMTIFSNLLQYFSNEQR